MKVIVIGCGDAFGAGGRLQTAYLLDHANGRILIDCGATTTMGLGQRGIDPNTIADIVITHLHGDHFSGLVWFLMHGALVSRRTAPLVIHGPPGLEARLEAVSELLYPGMRDIPSAFEVSFREMTAGHAVAVAGVRIEAFAVQHPSGAPAHALRCEADGKVFAFTGDTTWTDAIVDAGRAADLYLMECYTFDRPTAVHLDWKTLERHLDRIGARRTVLTHMGVEMLARRGDIDDARITFAEDGAVFDI